MLQYCTLKDLEQIGATLKDAPRKKFMEMSGDLKGLPRRDHSSVLSSSGDAMVELEDVVPRLEF